MSVDNSEYHMKKTVMIKKMIKKQQISVHNSKSYIKITVND